MCVPMAAFQLLNELFRVFDLAITARINPESVAAVSFFNQLNNSVTAVGTGLSIGAGILIAGFYGAADYENVKKTVNTTFFLAVGGALLLAISLILSGKWVLRLANTPEELVEIGWNYYRVIMVNLVFVFFNNVYVAIEKARGNGGRILGVNLLMAAAKFTLSGVFVLIFRQGVVMIAFSTLLSNLLVTLIGIYSLRDPKDVFGISLEYIRMDRLFIKKLFGISLPVMAEKFAFSTGKVVVNSVGVDYGTQTVGALGVSNSISALSTVPAGSIGDGGASHYPPEYRKREERPCPEGVQKRISGGRGLGNIGIFTYMDISQPDSLGIFGRRCSVCPTDPTDFFAGDAFQYFSCSTCGDYGAFVCLRIYQAVLWH